MRYLGLVLLLVLAGCGALIQTFPAPPQDAAQRSTTKQLRGRQRRIVSSSFVQGRGAPC